MRAQYGIVDQNDYLYRVVQGGYYGHPNPQRCEWVLNGGNPTSGADPFEVTKYLVGTQPDRNFRGVAYDFNVHKSPNGMIEYKSDVFDGALKGWLIVTRYSENDDLIALQPGGPSLDIVAARERVQGSNNSLSNPLDLVEDTRNGNLYVIEFSAQNLSRVSLLKPVGSDAPRVKVSPADLIFSDVAGDSTASGAQTVTIENIGKRDMTVGSITPFGTDANQFMVVGAKPTIIRPGEAAAVSVAFKAGTPGPKSAILRIATDAVNSPVTEVVLRGLGAAGTGGDKEPSLQWVLDTYEIAVNVGDDDPSTNVINSVPANQRAARLGDEIGAQRFVRADNANPVTIEPIAVFGPTANNPVVRFGWYPGGSSGAQNEIFQVGNSPSSNAQRLAPTLLPGADLTFDPGTEAFGFYSTWPFFNNRTLYSQDALNTFSGAIPHHVRVYPLKDSTGAVVENAYVIATEEHTSGFDYQDVVVIARNLKPAGGDTTPPNNPPSADAGADLTVDIGTTVALAGSASDLDSDPLTYTWAQSEGPSVTLSGADTLTPSFVAPGAPAELAFELTVSDGKNAATDSVVVEVINSPIEGLTATSNGPTVLGRPTSFSASVANGSGVTFSWDFGDGQTASGANVSHIYREAGDYTATVEARKGGNSLNASVAVQVTNAKPVVSISAPARVLVGTGVVLNGAASADPDGESHAPLSFTWVQVSGTAVTLSNANTAQASFTAPGQADTLEFELTVSDRYGLSTPGRVVVVVENNNVGNRAPVANAGADMRVRVGGAVALDGGASFDPDGHSIGYAWSQVGGPNVVLGVTNEPTLRFTAPGAPAELIFELTVTDSFGKSASDQVKVLVRPAAEANDAPVAKAGPDLRVPPSTGVTLDAGESSDPNGDALSFAWRQVSGPAVTLMAEGARVGFFTPNGPTTLLFEVTVTDAFGKSAADQVKVTVEPITRPNDAPLPNAGPDQRAPLASVVTLDARASSDPNGDALTFQWRQVSGPALTISGADGALATVVTPASAATLVFEVTVTDAFGASDADRVSVIVGPSGNQPPVAAASAPERVTPGASVQLNAGASHDPDGDAISFQWRQVRGPAVALVGAQTASPSFVAPMTAGELVFEVTVTDAFGAKSTARVTVRTGVAPAVQKLYLPLVSR
ncbi:PKD domain-containing protein [Scytonema tolypothrichoides VB-61278]|nr:PKD domain-containing protein [Scytonema tolypothrichoides VB-61278]